MYCNGTDMQCVECVCVCAGLSGNCLQRFCMFLCRLILLGLTVTIVFAVSFGLFYASLLHLIFSLVVCILTFSFLLGSPATNF